VEILIGVNNSNQTAQFQLEERLQSEELFVTRKNGTFGDSIIFMAVTSFFFRIAMQREKKIKTIQEEISFCRDIGVREGMTFPRSVRLYFDEKMRM